MYDLYNILLMCIYKNKLHTYIIYTLAYNILDIIYSIFTIPGTLSEDAPLSPSNLSHSA